MYPAMHTRVPGTGVSGIMLYCIGTDMHTVMYLLYAYVCDVFDGLANDETRTILSACRRSSMKGGGLQYCSRNDNWVGGWVLLFLFVRLVLQNLCAGHARVLAHKSPSSAHIYACALPGPA